MAVTATWPVLVAVTSIVMLGAWLAPRTVGRLWRYYRHRQDARDTAYADKLIKAASFRYVPGMERDDQALRERSAIERHRRALRSLQSAPADEMTPRLRQMRAR